MPYQLTTATQKLLRLRKRIKGIAGGASAGKTISILQILIDKAQSDTTPTLTSVTSESMPHLKRGAMRDFINIMESHHYFNPALWNKTDFTYTFETGSKLEFFSLDQPHKVRGPRRQRLFINEANNIPHETFDQLEIRTEEEIWLDWNPTSEFWFYTDVVNRDDVDFEILTYKDNEGLHPSVVEAIERRRDNKSWWRVYGEGQLGEVEGRIYTGWEIVDTIPEDAQLLRYGLDFGYSNDPTAIVSIWRYNGTFIVHEEVYQKGLLNNDIVGLIKKLPRALVVADSAEPKSIQEISVSGVGIVASIKGQGSVQQGIGYVQEHKIAVTKSSTNLIKEYRNYMWATDVNGKFTRDPVDIWNHALDALRYAINNLKPTAPPKIKPQVNNYQFIPGVG